jgi:transposase InsO family protein
MTETANVMAKKMLEEIFLRFGIPKEIGSDNGPAFVAQVSQGLAKILGIDSKFHCAYRPKSSGQVERMNKTIKETINKLTAVTGTNNWIALLPFVLYKVRNTPGQFGLTPYELLYRGPPPLVKIVSVHNADVLLSQYLFSRLKALEWVRQ